MVQVEELDDVGLALDRCEKAGVPVAIPLRISLMGSSYSMEFQTRARKRLQDGCCMAQRIQA
jgi:hypothetical protein